MQNNDKKCGKKTEVYSRVVGFFRPVSEWNEGKKQEFKERNTFSVDTLVNRDVNNEDSKW